MPRTYNYLTDRQLRNLKPKAKPFDVMEGGGFGVRVLGTAEKPVLTFILRARFPGSRNPTRRAIGTYPETTLETARETAAAWRKLIKTGKDPRSLEEEHQRLDEGQRKQANHQRQFNAFDVVAEEYIRRHVSKTRKAEVVAREIRREFVRRWGSKPLNEITRQDVVRVIDEAVDRGAPYQAHNLLGHIRTLFNWAIGRGIYGIESSPCDRLKPAAVIGKKASRKRVLNDDEIRALWNASERLGYPTGPLYKLLLLTGQRKSEVAEARWQEFNLQASPPVWIIPAERMKTDSAHLVPLSAQAIDILQSLPRFTGDHIFTTTFGQKPISGFSKYKRRLDAAMLAELKRFAKQRGAYPNGVTLEPFVIHDVRRTVRTRLSALSDVSDKVKELVIAHRQKGLHKVYDLHAYEAEKRRALDLWSERLHGIVAQLPAQLALAS